MRRLLLPCTLAALAATTLACGGASSGTAGGTTGRRDVTTVNVGGSGALRLRTDEEVSSATIGAPVDAVWQALTPAFDSLGLKPNLVDPRQRVAGVEAFKIRQRLGGVPLSRYFDCGTTQIGANADSYELLVTVIARLKPGTGGTTTLEITSRARARPVAFSQGYSECQAQSTTLDDRLVAIVRREVSRRQ